MVGWGEVNAAKYTSIFVGPFDSSDSFDKPELAALCRIKGLEHWNEDCRYQSTYPSFVKISESGRTVNVPGRAATQGVVSAAVRLLSSPVKG